jgi:hypothetical protein
MLGPAVSTSQTHGRLIYYLFLYDVDRRKFSGFESLLEPLSLHGPNISSTFCLALCVLESEMVL